MVQIMLGGMEAVLLPQRAVYFPHRKTLMIADTHWGKSAVFRSARIAIPDGDLEDDLARLTGLLAQTKAEQIIVLGDLVHAERGYHPTVTSTVQKWRDQHPELSIVLIRGNHDASAGDPPPDWSITCFDPPFVWESLILYHHPQPDSRGYVLAGHLHPAALLTGRGRQSLKLPCFALGEDIGILPAFGSFISHAIIRPGPRQKIYVVTDTRVIGV